MSKKQREKNEFKKASEEMKVYVLTHTKQKMTPVTVEVYKNKKDAIEAAMSIHPLKMHYHEGDVIYEDEKFEYTFSNLWVDDEKIVNEVLVSECNILGGKGE